MKLRSVTKTAAMAAGVLALLVGSGCSRDHIEAINLANRGDKSVKVNVENAISQYQQALQLDPTNHRILWKLAKAYEKKEDWDKMASTLSRAVQVAPSFANYWANRGYALVRRRKRATPTPTRRRSSRCRSASKRTRTTPSATTSSAKPICGRTTRKARCRTTRRRSSTTRTSRTSTRRSAETYISLKFYDQAGKVLKEGTRLIQPSKENNNNLYGMYVLRFQVAQANDDKAEMVASMEQAQKVAGDTHPGDRVQPRQYLCRDGSAAEGEGGPALELVHEAGMPERQGEEVQGTVRDELGAHPEAGREGQLTLGGSSTSEGRIPLAGMRPSARRSRRSLVER